MAIVIAVLVIFAFSDSKKREAILTKNAPTPIGPYSQAIKSDHTLYVSGQIALKPDGSIDTSNVESECRQAMDNIKAIVEAAGKKMSDINKATIYTTNLKQFSSINEVYKTYFLSSPPARETVQVNALPKGAHVEISVIAE